MLRGLVNWNQPPSKLTSDSPCVSQPKDLRGFIGWPTTTARERDRFKKRTKERKKRKRWSLNRGKSKRIRKLKQSSHIECAQRAGLVGREKIEGGKGENKKKELRHCADGDWPGKAPSHRHLTDTCRKTSSIQRTLRSLSFWIRDWYPYYWLIRSMEYVSTGLTVVESWMIMFLPYCGRAPGRHHNMHLYGRSNVWIRTYPHIRLRLAMMRLWYSLWSCDYGINLYIFNWRQGYSGFFFPTLMLIPHQQR